MRFHIFLLSLVSSLLMLPASWGTPALLASLPVTGGTAAQQETLNRAYSGLPTCCQASRPVCVRLLDTSAMDACLQAAAAAHTQRLVNADAVDGFYQNSSLTITLRIPPPTADVSATFVHEYGHYVWMNVLSPAQRDQYQKVYKAQRTAGRLVSPYATVSVEEGFAEAFTFYVRDRPHLERCDSLSFSCLARVLGDTQTNPKGTPDTRPS